MPNISKMIGFVAIALALSAIAVGCHSTKKHKSSKSDCDNCKPCATCVPTK